MPGRAGSEFPRSVAWAFARFGDLYLNDGVAPDGQRILPQSWVAWSRHSVIDSAYGAGFWTNDGPNEFAAWRVEQGFPKDGFYADGYLGQKIYIVPSEHIVIARFAYSRDDNSGAQEEDDYALIASVIRATHGSQ